MKTKCSFILKASTALVLCFLMLFGTVTTSLAAVVDSADTGAEADVADEGAAVDVADEAADVDIADTGWNYGGKTILIKPEGTWKQNNESYRFRVWGGDGEALSAVATSYGSGIYKTTIPTGSHTGGQWVRVNASSTNTIWDYGPDWNGTSNALWISGSNNSQYDYWTTGTTVYFDCTANTSWENDSAKMFTKGSNSGTTDGNSTTKIATHLYKYTLSSDWDNCGLWWWRGSSASALWNYSAQMDASDAIIVGKNAVSPTGSGVTSGNGTVAALSLTSISAPTLSATTETPTYGDANTITASGNTLNYSFNGGARTTTLLSTDAVYNFYVDGSSTPAQSSTTKTYDASGLSAGTHTITCTISSALTGLTSSAGSVSITVAAPTHTVSRSGSAPSNGTIEFSLDNSTWSDGPITVAEGGTYYVKATPSSHYKISSFTVGGSAVSGASGSTSAKTYTGTMGSSDVTASAAFTIQTFNVKKDESGASGGTVEVGSTTIGTSNTSVNYGTDYTVTIEAPSGYNVSAVSGVTGTTSGLNTSSVSITGVTISADTTIEVTYASAGSCGFTLSASSGSVNIGGTTTFTATPNDYHSSGTISAASSDETVATVSKSGNTYTVTGVAPGTATITVSCTDSGNTPATYTVTVNTPTISVGNKTGLKIGETYTPEPTLSNPSTTGSDWTVVYSRTSGTYSTTDGSTITGDTYNSGSTTFKASFRYNGVEKAYTTFTVKTADATISMTDTAVSLDIGGTATRTATGGNIGSGASGSISYSSNATGVASVNSSSGLVTAKAPGSATITATYTVTISGTTKCTKTATYTVNVSTPSLTMNNITGKEVGDTGTFSPASYSNPSTIQGTVSYAIKSGDSITVSGSGYTAVKAGTTTVTATYNYSNNSQTYTCDGVDFTVTVTAPTVSLTAASTLAVGDSTTVSGSSSGATTSPTWTYSITSGGSYATINTSTGVLTGTAAGTVTVKGTANYGNGYTLDTAVKTVTVEAPSIDITDIADDDVVYSTVGTNITKSISNNFNGAYSITYNDGAATSSIATASVSNGTLTIAPQAKGTVTVHITATKGGVGAMTPSYLNSKLEIAATGADVTGDLIGTGITATQTFTVNVAEANTNKYFYFTKGSGLDWSSVYAYMWNSSNDSNNSWPGETMTYIGTNENSEPVYAISYTANYNRIIITNQDQSARVYIGGSDTLTLSTGTNNAVWSTNSDAGYFTCSISIPQVSIDDASTPLGNNYTLNATKVTEANVGEYRWTSSDTGVATVTADTDTTASTTVTPVDAGTTTVTVKAFAVAPNNWSLAYDQAAALPFIGSTDTAVITVTADDRTVTYAPKLSLDHSDYDTESGTAAGSITTSPSVASGGTVAHGTTVTFTASANSGYKHVGWRVGTGSNEFTTSAKEIRVTSDTTVYALFDKYYALTISESADHGVVTSSGEDVVWNNTPSTFTVTPAAGYMIDYANCTNLSKYYTVDTSATTGTVTFTGKTVDAGDKTTATITIAYKAILPVINYTAKKTDDGSTLEDGGGTITAKEIEYNEGTPGTGTASYYYLWWSGSDNPEQHNIKADAVKATDGSYYASFQPSGNFYFNITDSSSSATSGTQKLTSSTTGDVGDGFASWTTVGNWSSYYIGKGYLNSGDTVYIKFDPTENKVYFQNSAFTYTIEYAGGDGGTEATETEIKTLSASGDTISYDHRVYFTASAASDYAFEGWYSDASCTTLLSTDKTYKTDNITAASYTIYAKFKKLSYITLYNSYMRDSNNNWQFVASPPRKVEIYANASASTPSRTYVYDTGGGEQRGEEYVLYDGGTYYEGNKLVVYPGEKIKLIFSTLASSDAIKGVFFNNDRRYTTESQDDNLYYLREYREGGWTESDLPAGAVADDDWDYDFMATTTIFADAGYYTDEASTISAQESNYAAKKTGGAVDQSAHTVEWIAEGSYLNVDIQLDYKYQVHINNDDWSGLKIENMNDEGYYYHGEDFTKTVSGSTAQFKISLEQPTDGTGTYSWTDTDAILSLNSNPSTPEPPSDVTVTAKKSDGTTASSVSEVSYFIVEGEMPNSALYITLPISKKYNLKLANIVVSDGSTDAPTMLTETNGGTTSSTGNIGTITALDKASSSDAGTSVVASGNWYTYRANNGNPATGNDHVSVYDNNDYNNNRYLAGGVNRDGALVEDGHTVTYTFNFASGKEAEYTFVGWFEGTYNDGIFTVDYNKKLSGKQTFTYTPKKDTVVIAVGTRDIYIGGNFTSTGSYTSTSSSQTWASGRILMEFDPTYEKTVDGTTYKGRYYYTFDSVLANTEYKFRCYDTVGGSEFANLSVWNAHLSDIHGYYNDDNDIFDYRSKYDAGSGNWTTHGGFMFTNRTDRTVRVEYDSTDYGTTGDKSVSKNHTANGYGNPVNVYFYAYDSGISVDSTYQWSKAYVSAGVGIDVQSVSGDTTTYNTPSVSVANTTVAGGTVDGTTSTVDYGQEKIYECTVKEANGQIQVTANPNDTNLCVQAFLIYNIDTKASEAVMVNSEEATGAITANITVPQNSNIYIVPIYKFTQAWIDTQNALADESKHVESHTVYVRASDIDKDDWGGLVSMYSWGTTKGYDSGGWPGQLMIPSDDGQSFYAPLTYLHNGLAGVTFNNYTKVWGSAFVNFLGLYQGRGVSDTVYSSYTNTDTHYINQAYDYREPISIIDNINEGGIYDSDDMDLTFALKPGNKNGTNFGASTYSDSYDFEYLTDRSGKKRVDLNGNVLSTSATATYYVVCKYTRDYVTGKDYDFKDGSRDGSSTHNAFSIEWAVYDQTHTKIGSEKLSAAYTDVYKSEMLTYVAKMLDSYGYPVSGKAVKIAYEDPAEALRDTSNQTTEAKRFSGQWYADGVNSLIEGNVRVGIYADGAWLPSDTNAPGYATATVGVKSGSLVTIPNATTGEQYVTEDGCTGNSLVKVTKTHATNGNITFSVNTTDNFLGWYRDDGEGGFEPIGSNYKSQTITPSFGFDTTYYAFYSASATYRFKYNDRFGNAKYYTAKGTGLTGDEMTAGGTLDAATRASDITSKLAGVSGIKVFNNTTSYELGTPDTSSPYTITYTANQTVDSHTLTVMAYKADGTAYEEKTTVSGTWATPVNLDKSYVSIKPNGHSDYEFIGWKKYNTEEGETEGDILSTQANFGYSVVEEMTIAPVFGPSKITDETWAVGIDKNGTTQELTSEGKGTMYNDSLISFRYKKATGQQLDLTSGKECGIVILAQTAEARTVSDQADAFDAAVPSSYLTALKANNRTVAKMKSATYGEAYAYYVTASSLSRLNRADLFQAFDYEKFNGGQFRVMSYYYNGSTYEYSELVYGDLVAR